MGSFNHDTGGYIKSLLIAPPAAGNPFDVTAAAGTRIRLWSLKFQLVTDANVANRQILVSLREGVQDVMYCVHPTAQLASLTGYYSLSSNFAGQPYNSGAYYIFPWNRNIILNSIIYLRVTSLNIQAGDQFGVIYALKETVIGD